MDKKGGRLDEDACDEFITVNHGRSVIRFVTDNTEVGNTTTTLNLTKEWFNDVDEFRTSKLIVEFEHYTG